MNASGWASVHTRTVDLVDDTGATSTVRVDRRRIEPPVRTAA